jgi:hypothetical protein
MNRIRASVVLSTIMLLACSAFAWQYPGGQSQMPQQPQGSTQASPGAQPSQNQGAMQPGQSSSQQAQPGDQSQHQPQAGQAPAIDNQVQVLAQQLNLSVDQQAKVKTALEDQHTQAMSIIHDQSLQREDKIQKIHALRESTIAKVRATLTSDDQKQKFDQMVQAQDDRMHQQGQQTPPQPK